MIVGTLKMRLFLRESHSLKDKRRVVKSLKDRIRHKFNVSVAEVEEQDHHRQAVLGVAVVTNDAKLADSILQNVLNLARWHRSAELTSFDVEI